jgi:hypothetical protein
MSNHDMPIGRRTVLRAIGAAGALGASGVAGAADAAGTAASEPLGQVDVAGSVSEAVVGDAGGTAYVALDGGFAAVDVSDPGSPTVLARREDSGISGIKDVKVDGDRLIAVGPANRAGASNGAALYDVSDPARPTLLATHDTGYAIHNAYLAGDTAYLIDNGAAEMVVVDVGDDDPNEVARYGLQGASILHDVYVQSSVAYLAYWNDGTAMVDVSDRTNPSLVGLVREGSSRSPNNDHYVMPNDDGSVVAIGKELLRGGDLGIELWDISDPTDTAFRAEIDPPDVGGEATSHNFDVAGGYLYSSWYTGGVRVHDVSDPSNPTEVDAYSGDGASFWTAKLAQRGSFFVGSDESAAYGQGRLVTFADPRGGDEPALAVTTDGATDVGSDTATLNGTLTDLGGASAADVAVEYRETGSSSFTTVSAGTQSSTGSFSADVSGLAAATDYEFRATVEASDGDTATGPLANFTTDRDGGGGDDSPAFDAWDWGSSCGYYSCDYGVEWTVSDQNGDLAAVESVLVDEDGSIITTDTTSISGSSASGTHVLESSWYHDPDVIETTVTDANGNEATERVD